jgi:hypothetical protein
VNHNKVKSEVCIKLLLLITKLSNNCESIVPISLPVGFVALGSDPAESDGLQPLVHSVFSLHATTEEYHTK